MSFPPEITDRTFPPPPDIPSQGVGPRFEFNADGKIDLAPPESLDREGNHLPTLRALHPHLCALAVALAQRLPAGNNTHPLLGDRIAAYRALIDQDLAAINFRLLWLAGLRLRNAQAATDQAIAAGELPTLNAEAREEIDSLLQAHGPFILATTAGAEAIAAEQTHERTPEEEQAYRVAALDLAQTLQASPEVITLAAATTVSSAVAEIGQGPNPTRGTVSGSATVRNVTITTLAGATLAGLALGAAFIGGITAPISAGLIAWAGFKALEKSAAGQETLGILAKGIDAAAQADARESWTRLRSRLAALPGFVRSNTSRLRRLVTPRFEDAWLGESLKWLDQNDDKTTSDAHDPADPPEDKNETPPTGSPPDDFDLAEARRLILAGEAPKPSWRPFITILDFSGERNFSSLAPIAGLANLQRLNLVGTQVSDIAAIAGLAKLQRLDLMDTQVSDLAPIVGLANLQNLSLAGTQVSDLAAIAGLANLRSLSLAGTKVSQEGVAAFHAARIRLGVREVRIDGEGRARR